MYMKRGQETENIRAVADMKIEGSVQGDLPGYDGKTPSGET